MNEKTVEPNIDSIGQHVDSLQAAATLVAATIGKATDTRKKSLQLANIPDEWERTKAKKKLLEDTEKIADEAVRACGEADKHWRAVQKATFAYPKYPDFLRAESASAHRAAKCARRTARDGLLAVNKLVRDVKQNCEKY